MAVRVIGKSGKRITLLNPSEKGSKYSAELKRNIQLTNNGSVKTKNGKVKHLTSAQRTYRMGFITAQHENARAFNSAKRKRKWGK